MENFRKIIQKIKFPRSGAKTENELLIRPIFYWRILILIFAAGLLFIFLLNVYLFRYLNIIKTPVLKDEEISNLEIKKESLNDILKELEKRKIELEKLKSERKLMSP